MVIYIPNVNIVVFKYELKNTFMLICRLQVMCALMNVYSMTGGNHNKYIKHKTDVEKSRIKKNKVELQENSKVLKCKCDFTKCINKQPNGLFDTDMICFLSETLNTIDVDHISLDWFDDFDYEYEEE